MAIIKVTKADLMQSKLLDPAWYKAKILKVDQAIHEGKTVYDIHYEIDNGKIVNRRYFSVGHLVTVFNAAFSTTFDEGSELDTDKLHGKPIQVELILATSKTGTNLNNIDKVAPIDADMSVPY